MSATVMDRGAVIAEIKAEDWDTPGPEQNRGVRFEGNRKERRKKAAEVRKFMKRVRRAWEVSRR